MSKNFITLLFTSSKTEPAFLSDSRLCELNVDILWTRTTYLCATAYPCYSNIFRTYLCYYFLILRLSIENLSFWWRIRESNP